MPSRITGCRWANMTDLAVSRPDERRLRAAAESQSAPNWALQSPESPWQMRTIRSLARPAGWNSLSTPTSAQWEKAARGVDGRLWPGIDGTADISPYGLRGFASWDSAW